jgi:benzoyl-CoA reductase/2-hydroxyglutaryl-CoA dehydratase subunit BcrC/BadD/HgdB
MDNIKKLQDACANPRKQLDYYLSQGKKVVGCFPPYAPEELVHSSGMIPFGLWGGNKEAVKAASYLPPFACPIMQADLEYGLSGTYKGLSACIIPALCDTLRCMTQNWRFGVPEIPMIPIVYPQNRENPASITYLEDEFETVLTMLATITGQMMTEAALCHTIEIYNAHNEAMNTFCQVANEHLDIITPAIRHEIMKSAFFFEKEEHTKIMNKIIEELRKLPVYQFHGPKVILTGIVCEPKALLDLFEKNHLAVVADDLAQESRQYRTDSPLKGGGALKRLALQWINRRCCSLIYEKGKPRGAFMVDLCKKNGAIGVINCSMKFCDPEEYDQPYFIADLKKAGIPTLTLDIDQKMDSLGQMSTKIQSFAEMLS